MSFLKWARSSTPLKKQGSSTKKEDTSRSRDEHHPRDSEGGNTKQEQADKQSDAGPRRYDGGDIYRKGYRGEEEKANSTS